MPYQPSACWVYDTGIGIAAQNTVSWVHPKLDGRSPFREPLACSTSDTGCSCVNVSLDYALVGTKKEERIDIPDEGEAEALVGMAMPMTS
jgi:hypothetical protein